MLVLTTKREVRDFVAAARRAGSRVGLVPTMGALHAGHASLVAAARDATDVVVVSVFVNPAQFGPHEDFDRYPRTLEADCELLDALGGVDAVFAPSVAEMYVNAADRSSLTNTRIVPGPVAMRWEGARRPGHFEGVALVVTKLLAIVAPDEAFFGEKDYQQLCVVREVTSELDLGVAVVGCPTVRESDGLALSSRNRYLSPAHRALAPSVHEALTVGQLAWARGEDAATVGRHVADHLRQRGGNDLVIDYIAVVDGVTLDPMDGGETCHARGATPGRVLVAVELGGTHLIDNIAL